MSRNAKQGTIILLALLLLTVAAYAIGDLPIADAGPDQNVNSGVDVQFDGSGSYDTDWAFGGTEFRVTTDNSDQINPSVYGDIITWEDQRNNYGDIYIYNLSTGTESRIAINDEKQVFPSIYDDVITWQEWGGWSVGWDIYMYNLSTGTKTRVTTSFTVEGSPSIYGDIIAYEYNDASSDIYIYNISTGTRSRISPGANIELRPSIHGDTVIWYDYRNGDADIYMYNLSTSTESRITTDTNTQLHPAIYGNIITWYDYRNGDPDIYIYDISTSTESQITTHPNTQFWPSIYGNTIAWQDNRHGHYDIFIYDMPTGTEFKIAGAGNTQSNPSIHGSILTWQDNRNGNYDIYAADVPLIFEWDFQSDSSYDATGVNPTHAYPSPGTYTVTLRVTETDGLTATNTMQVTVNAPPVANAGSDQIVGIGTDVLFSGLGSSDPEGGPLSYDWDFGDAACTPQPACTEGTGATTSHTYALGTYIVALEVTDDGGLTDTDTMQVTVEGGPPVAVLTYTPPNPRPTETVTLDASDSFDPDGDTLQYRFLCYDGDGGSGWIGVDSYDCTYASADIYQASLDVADGTFVESIYEYITVSDNLPPTCSATATPNPATSGSPTTLDAGESDPEGNPLACTWTLVDSGGGPLGSLAGCSVPTTQYEDFTATVLVVDDMAATAECPVTVTVECGASVTTAASADPMSGTAPLDVTWSATGDPAWLYAWSFSDGGGMAGQSVLYQISDTATGTVEVTDTYCFASDSVEVAVYEVPIADAGDDQVAKVNTEVAFDGTGSTGEPTSYDWDFGDTACTPQPSCTQDPSTSATHTYTVIDVYTVTLTVTNAVGSDTDDATAHVADKFALAEFDASGSTGSITAYEWDFGDPGCALPGCNTATGVTASHTYTVAADYTVTLTVYDAAGSESKTRLVQVLEP